MYVPPARWHVAAPRPPLYGRHCAPWPPWPSAAGHPTEVSGVDKWQYLVVLGLCVLATSPLEVVGGARVYRRPRALLRVLVPVMIVFGGWDLLAVRHGDWWYNARYTIGLRPFGLPVEEWLFFLVVPACALLTYEVLGVLGARAACNDGGRRRGRKLHHCRALRARSGRRPRGQGAAHRAAPPPQVLADARDHPRIPDPGGWLADQAQRAHRQLPDRCQFRGPVALGYPGRGFRLRHRDDHLHGAGLGAFRTESPGTGCPVQDGGSRGAFHELHTPKDYKRSFTHSNIPFLRLVNSYHCRACPGLAPGDGGSLA